jgi:hypothetical protein
MTRFQRLLPAGGLLALLLLLTSGCRYEGEEYLEPSGLKVQGGFPGFPDTDVFPPNYVLYDVEWPISLRFDLNVVAAAEEVTVQHFPPAGGDWSKRASTTSPIFWVDGYQPAPGTWMQRILIDGPRFVRPWLQEFRVWDRPETETGLIDAQVFHRRELGPEPLYTLMIFYDAATAAGVGSPQELFSLPPSSAALANYDLSEGNEKRAMRVVDQLERGTYYTMAAILDTSGDGVYDPDVDWWGYVRTYGTPGFNPLFVPATRGGLEEPLQRLEVELLPPPLR